jgi:isopentenyl diphosphate isomerase/L-lactate dehydrogenase-like FMN-dependent dehydrogenase
MKTDDLTRRQVLAGFGSLAAASPLLSDEPPVLIGEPPGRIAPRVDLVNVLEFEEMAKRQLAPPIFATIAGSDRSFFDRITFRPRMMVPTTHLDMSLQLFGEKMFAPIMAGPLAKLQTYHPDGEAGMARASSAAKTWMVISSDSSMPLESIAAQSSTVLWYQVFPEGDVSGVNAKMAQAVKSGCKAICITTGFPFPNTEVGAGPANLAAMTHSAVNWDVIDKMRKGINVPVLIKGIMTPKEAKTAVKRGVQGIVVSNYGGLLTPGMASSIELLASITEAVAGKIPVLIDGNFRRGSDIFKALAYGATAVMIGRPLAWGLAAYGPDGAQQVLEMLQTEVGRDMALCGKLTLKDIDRTVVKLHEA